MMRANALVDLFISKPLRFLAGKAQELTNWSPTKNNWALDLADEFLEKASHDGSLFLNAELNIFKPIADEQVRIARHPRVHLILGALSSSTRSAPGTHTHTRVHMCTGTLPRLPEVHLRGAVDQVS